MTTPTKHTPGPWQVEQSGNAEFISAEYDESRVRIAEVYQAEDSHGALVPCECEANAALIAQAPDLLRQRDKLREIIAALIQDQDDSWYCDDCGAHAPKHSGGPNDGKLTGAPLVHLPDCPLLAARAILAETEAKP